MADRTALVASAGGPAPPPIKVPLRADQAIRPVTIHLEAPAQRLHRPQRLGPPDVHDATAGARLKVQRPPLGEVTPSRRRLDPVRTVATMRRHEPPRSLLQARQARMREP